MCAFWRGRERMSSELGPLDCPPAPSFTPTPRRSMTTSVAPGHGASRAASDHDRGGFGARCYGAAFVPAGRSIGIGSWVGAWQLYLPIPLDRRRRRIGRGNDSGGWGAGTSEFRRLVTTVHHPGAISRRLCAGGSPLP